MLRSEDIARRYTQEFAIVEVDFPFRRGAVYEEKRKEVGRYNPKQYRPVMVMLDSDGKEVFKGYGGFSNPQEALILADYISGRHYRNVSWKKYLAEKFR